MKQRPQTFLEATEELNKAGKALLNAILVQLTPLLKWLTNFLRRIG